VSFDLQNLGQELLKNQVFAFEINNGREVRLCTLALRNCETQSLVINTTSRGISLSDLHKLSSLLLLSLNSCQFIEMTWNSNSVIRVEKLLKLHKLLNLADVNWFWFNNILLIDEKVLWRNIYIEWFV